MQTPPSELGSPKDAPAFPAEAVDWLVGDRRQLVVSLAPSYVTTALVLAGHHVSVVTDRSPETVDAVVTSSPLPLDLDALADLLCSGGRLTLVSSQRDHRIPWARKLDALLGTSTPPDPAADLEASPRFGVVEEETFRSWQVVNHESLAGLLHEELAGLGLSEREAKIATALELYDGYGRGVDGMQLPWVSRCFRATVIDDLFAPDDEVVSTGSTTDARSTSEPGELETELFESAADAMLLIDFR